MFSSLQAPALGRVSRPPWKACVFAHTILRALALMYVKPPAIGVSQFSLDKKKHGVHN